MHATQTRTRYGTVDAGNLAAAIAQSGRTAHDVADAAGLGRLTLTWHLAHRERANFNTDEVAAFAGALGISPFALLRTT